MQKFLAINVSSSDYFIKDREYILDVLSLAPETNLITWSYLQWSRRVSKFSSANTNSNY